MHRLRNQSQQRTHTNTIEEYWTVQIINYKTERKSILIEVAGKTTKKTDFSICNSFIFLYNVI